MTVAFVASIKTDHIACQQSAHQDGQGNVAGSEKKMGVIGHKGPGVAGDSGLGQKKRKSFDQVVTIFIGFESLSQKNLTSMNKGVNRKFEYETAIKKIQSHGILVHSSFIVGYDDDSRESFDKLTHFIQKNNLLVPLINILTPFPGTKLFKRFEKEGRILHKNWDEYYTKHVVFSPVGMSAEELLAGYRRILREVYSFDAILKKLSHYWQIDFWQQSNRLDPVKLQYRFLFAIRLCTLLLSFNLRRSKFIIQILPKVFNRRVRISTLLTLMAYNDFAYSL